MITEERFAIKFPHLTSATITIFNKKTNKKVYIYNPNPKVQMIKVSYWYVLDNEIMNHNNEYLQTQVNTSEFSINILILNIFCISICFFPKNLTLNLYILLFEILAEIFTFYGR